MLGRGILQNPGLVHALRAAEADSQQNEALVEKTHTAPNRLQKETLRAFHDEVCDGYKAVMSGDRNTLFKMKELWGYLGKSFTNPEKIPEKNPQNRAPGEYYVIVDALFREQELIVRL